MKTKTKMTPRARNEALWGYAFVAPTLIGLIILNFYPAINTVYQSFCKTGDFGKGNTFVGLANYSKAFAGRYNRAAPCGISERKNQGSFRVPYNLLPPDGLCSRSCRNGLEMAL